MKKIITSDVFKAFLFSIFLIIVFSAYFFLIGIPLTNARNLTIEAVELADDKEYNEAIYKLEEANMIQETEERNKLIKEYREKL